MHYSPYKSPHPLDNELQQESSRASMAATMLDDATSLTISGSYIDHLPSMFDLNHQNQIMCGYPLFSSAQGEPICDLFANAHISTNPLYLDSHTFLSRPAQILESGDVTLAGYRLDNGAQNEEHFGEEGTLVPATVLASLLASRRSHSPRNLRPFDDPSPCFDRIYDNQIQGVLYPPGLDSQAPNFQPYYPSATAVFSNELSLSLATSHSCRASQPSPESSGSTYLSAVQRILADLSRFSLENVTSLTYAASSPTHVPANSGACSGTDGSESSQVADSRKKQLKALLKMLDQGQDQCSREVRNVMSAFHPVTGLDPDLHLRFVLQTTSYMFKTVKERISAQILDMNARSQTDVTKARAFESSFIHKQWALQQLRRKEHQMWRPQRGLPEQSVSVLRSWMFQNFLHPYPKDSEKHMLAIKSGLTRSQVSNWFINARVRLWKPMIEEMYAEISKRKAHRKGHVSENYVRGHSSIGDQPFHCENETF